MVSLGGDYMILVGRDEIMSRFPEIPTVLQLLHKLYLVITLKSFIAARRNPSIALLVYRFAGTKFSHVIASAHLSGMKKLINTSV